MVGGIMNPLAKKMVEPMLKEARAKLCFFYGFSELRLDLIKRIENDLTQNHFDRNCYFNIGKLTLKVTFSSVEWCFLHSMKKALFFTRN